MSAETASVTAGSPPVTRRPRDSLGTCVACGCWVSSAQPECPSRAFCGELGVLGPWGGVIVQLQDSFNGVSPGGKVT